MPTVAAVLLVAAACSTGRTTLDEETSGARGEGPPTTVDDGDPGDASGLEWQRCEDDLAFAAKLQCATLEVPVDPAEPEGATIELELARSPAKGSLPERIGSLLFNPGGPGGSGIEALANLSFVLPEELNQRFDLVSWDPRGVAASSPVRCLADEDKDRQLEGDLSPDTPEERERAVADQAELKDACETNNPELVEHMSTADVASDLDLIREALGDDKLSYVGFSYGTAIGATYATMFPDTVRAMVLDGAVSPSADSAAQSVEQAKGFENTYLQFVAACDADPACALTGGADAKVQALRERLDATPMTVKTSSGSRTLGMDLFDVGLATAMYDTTMWGLTAEAIAGIDDGGAEVILALTDAQLGRQPDGTWDNSIDSRAMVNCLDDELRPTLEEAEQIGQQAVAAAPTFGDAFVTSGLGCVDWPLPANPVPKLTGAGAPPILVIGTVGDPATPYAWAEQMAAALESGVLLTYEGSGHTAFTRAGSCVDDIVVRYLVDLQVPPAGTSCAAQDDAITFEGVEAVLLDQLQEAGIPEDVAECIVEELVAEVGANELALGLLQQDQLEREVTKATMRCMAGG